MKKTVNIPRGGLPPWRPRTAEPDSKLHSILRTVGYVGIGLTYIGLMVLHLFQVIRISHLGMSILAVALVLSIPAIDYLVRPGKGRVWLLTILLLPVFVLLPILLYVSIVALPVVILIAQAVGPGRKRKTSPTGRQQ